MCSLVFNIPFTPLDVTSIYLFEEHQQVELTFEKWKLHNGLYYIYLVSNKQRVVLETPTQQSSMNHCLELETELRGRRILPTRHEAWEPNHSIATKLFNE